jgi:hypothetical protein
MPGNIELNHREIRMKESDRIDAALRRVEQKMQKDKKILKTAKRGQASMDRFVSGLEREIKRAQKEYDAKKRIRK